MTFARILRRVRLRKKLTQNEVAVRAGLYTSHVSGLEVGRKSNPSAATVAALARALDVPVAELMAAWAEPRKGLGVNLDA